MTDYYEKLDKAKADFLRDADQHAMEVKLDEGNHRHLRFSRNGSSAYHFNITTWPGYLSISGDMGCFVFARTPDMFEFFRGDRINPGYWSEKLQATNKHSGHEAFSFALLKEAVASDFENWHFESDEQKAEAWKEIDGEWTGLFYDADGSDLQDAVGEVVDYVCPITKQKFSEFWDHRLTDYTFHFMWCCNAIQWAIQQYDTVKATAPAPQPNGMATGSSWQWWAGSNEEWCTVGPEDSREAIIQAATNDSLGECDDDGGWKLVFHIVEARQDDLRLSDWIESDRLLERAEESIADSDRTSSEWDDGPWFECSAEQEKDLEGRVKAACDQWQAAHGLKFSCSTFSATRNKEVIVVDTAIEALADTEGSADA